MHYQAGPNASRLYYVYIACKRGGYLFDAHMLLLSTYDNSVLFVES